METRRVFGKVGTSIKLNLDYLRAITFNLGVEVRTLLGSNTKLMLTYHTYSFQFSETSHVTCYFISLCAWRLVFTGSAERLTRSESAVYIEYTHK